MAEIKNPAFAKTLERQRQTQQIAQPQRRPNPPSPLRRTISTELMKTSMGFIGSAFAELVEDPAVAEGFTEMGTNIANTLHDRWWRHEYENFVSEHGEQYKASLSDLMTTSNQKMSMIDRGVYVDESGITQKINPASEEAMRLKNSLIRDMYMSMSSLTSGYMSAAGKYVNNPYINNEIQQILTSQTQMINQQFGPTPSDTAEAGIRETRLNRAKELYYGRMPADSGSGADKAKQKSFRDVIAERGISGAVQYALTNPTGQEMLSPYIDEAYSGFIQDAIRADRTGTLANDEAQQNTVVQANKTKLQKKAIGRAIIDAVGPTRANEFFETKQGKDYKPAENQRITTNFNKEQRDAQVQSIKVNAIDGLRDMIRNKEVRSYEEAIDAIVDELSLGLRDTFAPSARNTADKIKREIINWLHNNKDEIEKMLPEIASLKGFKEKGSSGGLLGEAGRAVGATGKKFGGLIGGVKEVAEEAAKEIKKGYREAR